MKEKKKLYNLTVKDELRPVFILSYVIKEDIQKRLYLGHTMSSFDNVTLFTTAEIDEFFTEYPKLREILDVVEV